MVWKIPKFALRKLKRFTTKLSKYVNAKQKLMLCTHQGTRVVKHYQKLRK